MGLMSPGAVPMVGIDRGRSGEIAGESRAVGRGDAVDESGEGGGTAIVGKAGRNGNAGAANFGVGFFDVLIGEKAEEFVLDDRAAEGGARGVVVETGDFIGGGNVGVGVVEKRGGVKRVGPAIEVSGAVEIVGAGGGAHIDVSAAGGTLLGIVHGSVDAKFFDGFGSGSGKSLTDGEIRRSGALQRLGGGAGDAGSAADAGVVDDAGAGDLAGAFAVEEIAGIDAVEEESVAGVALTVGPDGEIAQAGVDAGAAGEFGVDAGRKNGDASEAAGGQGDGFDLSFLENVAVGGVDGVEEGSGFDGDGGADLADFEDGVDGGGAIGLHDDGRNIVGFRSHRGRR